MQINAMTPMQMPGHPLRLYVHDAETGNVYGISFEGADVTGETGAYHNRFIGENATLKKRGKRFIVEGSGSQAECTLTIEMDAGRTFTQELTGPYDTREDILFFTELDPAQITGRVFIARLDDISGTDIHIRDTRMEYTPIDGGGQG